MPRVAEFTTLPLQYAATFTAILLASSIGLITYSIARALSIPRDLFRLLDIVLLTNKILDIPSLIFLYTAIRIMQSTRLFSACGQRAQNLADALGEFAYFTQMDVRNMLERERPVRKSQKATPAPDFMEKSIDDVQVVAVDVSLRLRSASPASDCSQSPTLAMQDPFGDEYEIESPNETSPVPFYKQISPKNGFPFSESARLRNLIYRHVEPIDCPVAKSINRRNHPEVVQETRMVIEDNKRLMNIYESPTEHGECNNWGAGLMCHSPVDMIEALQLSPSSHVGDLRTPVSPE